MNRYILVLLIVSGDGSQSSLAIFPSNAQIVDVYAIIIREAVDLQLHWALVRQWRSECRASIHPVTGISAAALSSAHQGCDLTPGELYSPL
jgi:hypothetical protein